MSTINHYTILDISLGSDIVEVITETKTQRYHKGSLLNWMSRNEYEEDELEDSKDLIVKDWLCATGKSNGLMKAI